jgi:hypothetical protein
MPPPEIPGYYYDEDKRKYFKVIKGGLLANTHDKYHHSFIQSQKRRQNYEDEITKSKCKNYNYPSRIINKASLLRAIDRFRSEISQFTATSNGILNLKLGDFTTRDTYFRDITDFVDGKTLSPATDKVTESSIVHIDEFQNHEIIVESFKLTQLNQISRPQIRSHNSINVLHNSPLEKHVSLLNLNFLLECIQGTISAGKVGGQYVVLTTQPIRCDGTINNFFTLQLYNGVGIQDYTERLLKFLVEKSITPEEQDIINTLICLGLIVLPKPKGPLDLRKINKIIAECGPNDYRVRQFMADYLNPSKGYSYKTGFADNCRNGYIVKGLLSDTAILLFSSNSDLIKITFDTNMNFLTLHCTRIPIKATFVNLISKHNFVHVLLDKTLVIFDEQLESFSTVPLIGLVKLVFCLLESKHVLIKRDNIVILTQNRKLRFQRSLQHKSKKTHRATKEIEVCKYFNDNDPFQIYWMFDNQLIINETNNQYKIINFNRSEHNIATFQIDLPFDPKKYQLKSIFKTGEYPLCLSFVYASKTDTKNHCLRYEI